MTANQSAAQKRFNRCMDAAIVVFVFSMLIYGPLLAQLAK